MAGLEVAERMIAASCSISTVRLAHGSVKPSEIALPPEHAHMDRRAAGAIGRGDRAHRALASPA
jgi:hypothetical protein